MLLKALRIGLGQLVVFVDWISRPRKLKRSAEAQAEVQRATADLALYQFRACPFCVKVRRTLHRLDLPVALPAGLAPAPSVLRAFAGRARHVIQML